MNSRLTEFFFAAEYLIEKLKMQKMIDIFSQYLPPPGSPFGNTTPFSMRACFSSTQEGQYEMSYNVLEIARKYNVSMVYTLGGYSIGKIIESPC